MKILHVVPSYVPAYRYGGPIKATHELCRALVKKGIEIMVYTTNADWEKNLDVPLNEQIDIEGVKVTYFPLGFPRFYCYSADLAKAVLENIPKFNIVHIHSVFLYPTFITAAFCRKYNVPYIINPCGALDPDKLKMRSQFKKWVSIKLIEERNIKYASAIHLLSAYEKEKFLSLGLKSKSVIVIPCGIDIQEYTDYSTPYSLKTKYPQLKDKKIILFLGRISFKKGLDLLIPAMKKIIAQRKDVFLVIAGADERGYLTKAQALCKLCGVKENTIFTGMLLGEDKLGAFFDSDIFVLPSYGDSFGVAVLEAMAAKLAVVITNRVGLAPDIQEYQAGMVTNCNSDKIAEAALSLLNNENLRKKMGENGKRLVEERFRWDKLADKMIEIYREILNAK